MSELAEFLLARIAEDEQAARAASGDPVYPHYGDTPAEETLEMALAEGCAVVGAVHFRRHDPDRVLAECDAKRRIVELHQIAKRQNPPNDPYQEGKVHGWRDSYNDALRLLAMPYADHEGFDPSWTI